MQTQPGPLASPDAGGLFSALGIAQRQLLLHYNAVGFINDVKRIKQKKAYADREGVIANKVKNSTLSDIKSLITTPRTARLVMTLYSHHCFLETHEGRDRNRAFKPSLSKNSR
jgi:hypothetical protein